jgi:hypothetical protein
MEKALAITALFLGVIALLAVLSLVVAWPVMLLWNWLMPEIFNLPIISFWQAYGLTVLCTLLFRSTGSSSSKS